MTNSAKFWDRMAKRYAKTPISNQQAYDKKLHITRKYFTPVSNVFEFGCGTGATAILHSPYVQNVRAIDISANMLDIAKENAASKNIDNISFEQAAIDDIQVADATYDVVLGLSILHLLPNRKLAMDKTFNMLKPGGVFISSTLCSRRKINPLKIILSIGNFFGLLPSINFFSPESLQLSLKDSGFILDHIWQPEKSGTIFIVAKKPT